MKLKRSTTCGAPRTEHAGETITVNGWVNKIRDTAGAVFIDLRDADGMLQLVFDKASTPDLYASAKALGREFVIAAKGKIVKREGGINKNLPTGEVEMLVAELEILNEAETPPIEVSDSAKIDPELRMKHRYLDLRRPSMQNMLKQRSTLTNTLRNYFGERGFLEIETPYLTKATPEGARDFIVPARLHPGSFYALPQSPQIFKQILMCSGVDKYMQIVRCFRDEANRADRQPEFTQLDLEMCFVEPSDIYNYLDGAVKLVMQEMLGVEIPTPIEHMPHSEAMSGYAIDRPDKRYDLQLADLSELMSKSGFGAFKGAVEDGGVVKALRVPGGDELISKGQFKSIEKDAKGRGAKGLAFIRYKEGELDSPIAKFFSEEELSAIQSATGAQTGDMVLLLADKRKIVDGIMAEYRVQMAERASMTPAREYYYLWVDDFPLFEYDEESNRLYAAHHPFTSPADEESFMALAEEMRRTERKVTPKIVDLAEQVKANAYDLILNGIELGGGSIRIHRKPVQDAMFDCLGIGPEEAEAKFGFLLRALSYGAPPMGGIALGIDRWIMLLLGLDTIQDVIAFPKSAGGQGLLDGSPSLVDLELLQELKIKSLAE